jgi:hydrogenase maturation protease
MSDEATLRELAGLLADPATAVVGLGNPDRGDDNIGIEMAKKLKTRLHGRVFFEPEYSAEGAVLELLESGCVKNVLFIDAVDFGAKPGTMKLFGFAEAKNFIPPVSTHKVPIALLMEILQSKGRQTHLLGIQPESMNLFSEMTDSVKQSLNRFQNIIVEKITIKGFLSDKP